MGRESDSWGMTDVRKGLVNSGLDGGAGADLVEEEWDGEGQ